MQDVNVSTDECIDGRDTEGTKGKEDNIEFSVGRGNTKRI